MTVTAQIDSAGLARVANNALAHFPANSKQVKAALVTLDGERLTIIGTDGYTAGMDSWPLRSQTGPSVSFEVTRETLIGWDKTGRLDKKGLGRLTYIPGDGSVFSGEDDSLTDEAHPEYSTAETPTGLWEGLRGMFTDVADQDVKTAFQPELLQRFSKVKADKTQRVADLAIADPEAPVLIRIGTTFVGLIMPVARERHATAMGDEDGLW